MQQIYSYLTTRQQPPAPFVYTPQLRQRQIRRGVFALLTDDWAAFETAFGHLFDRITGLVVVQGEQFDFQPKGPLLWQLVIPPSDCDLIPQLTQSHLQLIAAHRVDFRKSQKQTVELARIGADIEYWTNYSELVQDKLRTDLRQYTEWTINALTALLKFSTNQLQAASIEAFPELIVQFLRQDVFDDVAAAMLYPSDLPLVKWDILAQTDGWAVPIQINQIYWRDDVWQHDNTLFVPFIVNDEKYIIMLSGKRSKDAYSDYELTFYRLFSTLLEAVYLSKLHEQALNRALQTKDEFLANMSHELRTPLNAIMGRAEAMQAGIYGAVSKKQGSALKTIEESGKHLLSLINDVLTFAKMEATALELHLVPIDLHAICNASLRLVRDLATQKQIKVLFTMDHDVEMIQADERRLKQILLNLLSNAVKFTPAGGRVGLTVMGDEREGIVEITVWDKGIGIAEDDLAQLFKPFVQLDSRLSREYEGTGLGLALVDRLARLHGGSIHVESRVNKGSQFTVTLPWSPAQNAPPPSEPPPPDLTIQLTPQPTDAPTILLAEDNAMNREMLVEFLEFLGYRILIAEDGLEAVQQAQRHKPDLVLMDVQMPKLDGLEATRMLRRDPQTADMKIIALTGLAMYGDRERCLAAEVNDYLTKPISLQLLQEVIGKHIVRQPAAVI